MKRLHLLPQIIGGEALLDQLSKEKTLVAGGAEEDSIEGGELAAGHGQGRLGSGSVNGGRGVQGVQSRKVSAKRRLSSTQPAELKF